MLIVDETHQQPRKKYARAGMTIRVSILYREAMRTLPVFYNPVTRRIDPLVCEYGKKTMRRIFLQDGKTNFVLVYSECSRT